jgi:glycosyltransferase involved in cell wall biosynthesis
MITVSVITALYNEEDSVPSLITNFEKLLASAHPDADYQFIFVNDGSKDKTVEALIEHLPKRWKSQLISHAVNKGFGAALRTGIENAHTDIVVCYDADSTYPVLDIIALVNKVKEGWDVASANPFHEAGALEKVPLWRQALTNTNALLYKVSLGNAKSIRLFSCAFRAYKKDVIKSVQFKSNGFGAASEILGRLLIKKYSVVEIPSTLSSRQFGYSKMNVRKAAIEHFRNIGMFLRIRFFKY